QAGSGGGLAGHNGLRSLGQHLGSQDFERLRIGVGRPGRGDRRSVADWVLSPFSPEDDADALVSRSADAVETIVSDGLDAAQQRFNYRFQLGQQASALRKLRWRSESRTIDR